ncbi:MAG: hypothetical protein NZ959_05295 [Armatimonadetes bacterium]|nr:hypothetical protein [Armatimonadota bacterium]MDW8122249.1 hypothetical protein [Armatimonadota bacterium]
MKQGVWSIVTAVWALTVVQGISQTLPPYELHPSISNTGRVVFQTLLPPRQTDLFQFPVSFPPIPDPTFGVQAWETIGVTPVYATPPAVGEARPSIDASGNWVVCQRGGGVVVLEPTTGSVPYGTIGILPAISGSGRFVAFLSQSTELHDPDGNGDPSDNQPPNPSPPGPGSWILYLRDRDADEDGALDESAAGATWTRYLHLGSPVHPPLTSVRLSLDPVTAPDPTTDRSGWLLGLSFFNGSVWELRVYDISQIRTKTTEGPDPVLVSIVSNYPLSPPSLAGSRFAFTAQGALTNPPGPSIPAAWVFELSGGAAAPLIGIAVRGPIGAAVLSRDGRLLGFHTSASAFQRIGQDPQPLPFAFGGQADANAAQDVHIFDLVTTQPIWSTLLIRSNQPGGIGPYDPCTNPTLADLISGWIAFQQSTGQGSRVRIANLNTPRQVYR